MLFQPPGCIVCRSAAACPVAGVGRGAAEGTLSSEPLGTRSTRWVTRLQGDWHSVAASRSLGAEQHKSDQQNPPFASSFVAPGWKDWSQAPQAAYISRPPWGWFCPHPAHLISSTWPQQQVGGTTITVPCAVLSALKV